MSDSIELFERERFILQREREKNIDTDDPQFVESLKYGIRRDYNEWSLPRSLGDIQLFNRKLNCSITIAANFSSNLSVNLPKDPSRWRLKDRIPEERNYVIYSHNLNTLIKAPFGVVTAFPDDPNPMFYSYRSSEIVPSTSHDLAYHTSSSCSNLSQPEPVETNSVAIQSRKLRQSNWLPIDSIVEHRIRYNRNRATEQKPCDRAQKFESFSPMCQPITGKCKN